MAETFRHAAKELRSFQQGRVPGQEIDDVECLVDDESTGIVDTHGKPGDPAMEIACGVRVVEIHLSGPAKSALLFRDQNAMIADIRKKPSAEEHKKVLEWIIEQKRNSGTD